MEDGAARKRACNTSLTPPLLLSKRFLPVCCVCVLALSTPPLNVCVCVCDGYWALILSRSAEANQVLTSDVFKYTSERTKGKVRKLVKGGRGACTHVHVCVCVLPAQHTHRQTRGSQPVVRHSARVHAWVYNIMSHFTRSSVLPPPSLVNRNLSLIFLTPLVPFYRRTRA